MPVIKANNSTEKYQYIAQYLSHRNELTGRGGDIELTKLRAKYVRSNIMDLNLNLQKVVDVGCGDASFLIEINDIFEHSIGILPTASEVAAVNRILKHENLSIEIKEGLTTQIPEEDRSIDLIICNSVLHGVGFNPELVDRSFLEFKRVLKTDGILYIGEIPETNELSGRNYGTSITKYMVWTIRNRGLKAFWGQTVSLLRSFLTHSLYILQPTNMFYENNTEFRERLTRNGFEVIQVYESKLNEKIEIESEIKARRLDYICRLRGRLGRN